MGNVLLFPGGFKPFHDGHLGILEAHINNLDNIPIDEVRIYISQKGRDFIPDAMQTLLFLTEIRHNLEKVYNVKIRVAISNYVSPIRQCYIDAGDIEDNNLYALVSSNKDNDIARKKDFGAAFAKGGKYYNPEVGEKTMYLDTELNPIRYTFRDDSLNDEIISSTIIRSDIKRDDYYNFKCGYMNMLTKGIVTKQQLDEYYFALRYYVLEENK